MNVPSNLANILTMTRLALLPVIIVLFFVPFEWAAWGALGLYIVGAVTDGLDGWVARKFNQISDFGTLMDPISDKIYVVVLLLLLIAFDRVPEIFVLAVIAILTREFLVSGLREFLGPRGVSLPVTNLAKWKTATQMVSIGLLIVGPFVLWAQWLGIALLLAATILTVITGWDYVKTGINHLRGQ